MCRLPNKEAQMGRGSFGPRDTLPNMVALTKHGWMTNLYELKIEVIFELPTSTSQSCQGLQPATHG